MRIVSVQVGKPAQVGEIRTAYGKRPVADAVRVSSGNLEGDGQADPRYHGGPDMAVLAYSADHYPAWRAELDWPLLPFGGFGENLSVEGATEQDACIGDVWRAGSALLQIASPRKPCHKISDYWRRPGLLRLVERSGRTGWYMRVLEPGSLQAGDEIALVERPHPQWTVATAYRVGVARKRDRGAARELARIAALSNRWKAWLVGEPARV
ncbi:MAG: MOSC domain-containing protein [Myxococcales bacterium]|nr:MOSC domain-containing protein [Myxococcales bacterium]